MSRYKWKQQDKRNDRTARGNDVEEKYSDSSRNVQR